MTSNNDNYKNESKELNNVNLKNNLKKYTKEIDKTDRYGISDDKDGDTIESWYALARHVTSGTLQEFINHLMHDYVHTYDSYIHACTACGIAAVNACGTELSGFQRSIIAVVFPQRYYYNNKCGIKVVNFDDFLYPQYEYRYQNTITQTTWNRIQDEAKRLIREAEDEVWPVNPKVMEHWTSIVEGIVPFGYTVEEDD